MAVKIHSSSVESAHDWEHLFSSFKRFASKESRVIEIGASTLARTRAIASLCHKVIAVEYFPERIPSDIEGNIAYIQGDWQRLSDIIPQNTIDLAISSHVIEHIPDDLGALDELYDVLKPGGAAFINTPNRKRLIRSIIENFTGERKFPWWEHVREYIEPDLHNLIQRSKFPRYEIIPVCFGLQGGPFWIYSTSAPKFARHLATFWEIHLFKD